MISYFQGMYEDEILYSAVGRYSKYTCQSYRGTLLTIFEDKNTLPSVEFPSHLRNLAKNLSFTFPEGVDYLINKHTIYPYYSIFLPIDRQKSIRNKMINGDGKGIKTEVGFIAGSICMKSNLYYCSECAKEEILSYGERYFHRLHQAQGVYVCPKHKTLLSEYPIRFIDESRLSFITLDDEYLNIPYQKLNNKKLFDVMLMIASGVDLLLNNDFSYINKDIIHNAYIRELRKKDLVTINGRIRQEDLCKALVDFYGVEILTYFESGIDIYNEYNWVKILTRNKGRIVHPLRHLLFINFLTKDIEGFIKNITLPEKKADTFYPCLNPAADHYRQLTVRDFTVTADSKTRDPIGTFRCECGFIYSRRMNYDKYKIGRIKAFGETWESKLKNLILLQTLSISGIAKELRCDYKTVVKYASKVGLKELLKTHMNIECPLVNKKDNKNLGLLVQHRIQLIKFIQENPNASYSEVKEKMPKEISLIYRYDKDWIRNNIPPKHTCKNFSKIDYELWRKRDEEFCALLRELYVSLSQFETQKITKTMLIRKIGKQATIEKNLDKLPLCKDFLKRINNMMLH